MTEEEILNQEEEETLEQNEPKEDTAASDCVADEAAATDAPAEEPEEEKDPLEKALAEIELLKTQMLYKTAEFDNYRKRTLKEKAELILNGGEKAVSAILPIIDDMERAIENGAKTDDPQVLREGMELIYNKFTDILKKEGVEEIPAKGEKFDFTCHEALMTQKSDDVEDGYIIDELMKGYMYKDKVLKYSKVIVCKK